MNIEIRWIVDAGSLLAGVHWKHGQWIRETNGRMYHVLILKFHAPLLMLELFITWERPVHTPGGPW